MTEEKNENSSESDTESKTSVPLRIIIWIAGSAGISGILVATGFLVDHSFQSFLGYQLHHGRAASYYLSEGGEFVVTTIALVAETSLGLVARIAESHLVVVALFVLLATVVYLLRTPRLREQGAVLGKKWHAVINFLSARPKSVAAGIVLLTFGNIVYMDAPTLYINNLLTSNLVSEPVFDNELIGTTGSAGRWTDLMCMRLDDSLMLEIQDLDDEVRIGLDCLERDWHKDNLRSQYLWNLLLSVFLASLSLSLVWRKMIKGVLVVVSLVTLHLIDLSFLPYVYGKTLKHTSFNEVILHLYVDYDEDHDDIIEKYDDAKKKKLSGEENKDVSDDDDKSDDAKKKKPSGEENKDVSDDDDKSDDAKKKKPSGEENKDVSDDNDKSDDAKKKKPSGEENKDVSDDNDYDSLFLKRKFTQRKRVQNDHGFLLSRDENTLVFFHKTEELIWFVPADRVKMIKVERRGDVIEHLVYVQVNREIGLTTE